MEALVRFEQLVEEYTAKDGIRSGKMMSSPALQYQGKVFAFFHKGAMTFKLGKGFDPSAHGLKDWSYLSPFKNKPPMQAWVVVPANEQDHWPYLTELALDFMQQ